MAGFILMAMVKLRVDPEGLPKFTAVQAYFGTLAVLHGVRLAGARLLRGRFALGIQCESPAAFIGAGLAHGVRGREPHVRAGLRV